MTNPKQSALDLLDKLGIAYDLIEHPPLLTCEDALNCGMAFDGVNAKNLFIHNRDKSQYYLVVLPSTKRAESKRLQELLGATRLSFACEADLSNILGICRGAVSLLNITNIDRDGDGTPTAKNLTIVVDECIIGNHRVGFHPNVNTATVVFDSAEIPRILETSGFPWQTVKLKKLQNSKYLPPR